MKLTINEIIENHNYLCELKETFEEAEKAVFNDNIIESEIEYVQTIIDSSCEETEDLLAIIEKLKRVTNADELSDLKGDYDVDDTWFFDNYDKMKKAYEEYEEAKEELEEALKEIDVENLEIESIDTSYSSASTYLKMTIENAEDLFCEYGQLYESVEECYEDNNEDPSDIITFRISNHTRGCYTSANGDLKEHSRVDLEYIF